MPMPEFFLKFKIISPKLNLLFIKRNILVNSSEALIMYSLSDENMTVVISACSPLNVFNYYPLSTSYVKIYSLHAITIMLLSNTLN